MGGGEAACWTGSGKSSAYGKHCNLFGIGGSRHWSGCWWLTANC